MTHILIFGASITYGAWDEKGGWADRLKQFVHREVLDGKIESSTVYNCGVSGDSTEDVLERLEPEARARMSESERNVFIFSVGTNDSHVFNRENRINVPPEKYEENLSKIIRTARDLKADVIFVGLNPIDQPRVDPMPWAPEKSYKLENVRKYNEIMKSVCGKNNVPFVDLFEEWTGMNCKALLFDGVHPNTKGHELIFRKIKDVLAGKRFV